ncbi:MAG: hypothetical protein V1853_01785 [bacterium]
MKTTGWFLVLAILMGTVPSLVQAESLLVYVQTDITFKVDDCLTVQPMVVQLTRPAYMGLIWEEIEKLGELGVWITGGQVELADQKVFDAWTYFSFGQAVTDHYPVYAGAYVDQLGQHFYQLHRARYSTSFYREFWDTRVYGPIYFLVYKKVEGPPL